MSLFKKEEKSRCNCGENHKINTDKAAEKYDIYCPETASGISSIKVLGSGCKNCHTLLENTQKAVADMGIDVEVKYVTDMEVIMGYGVMSMPALAVNEKIVSTGKVLKTAEVEKLLNKTVIDNG